MVKKYFIIIFFTLSFFCINCGPKIRWQTSTFVYFDTICEIKLFCLPSDFISYQEEVSRIFSEVEAHFSPGTKDLSSPSVLELYHRALNIYHNSRGSFDITVGPLSSSWGFINQSFRIPSKEEIESILKFIGMDKIKEDRNKLILKPNMELDWGGIAKGYGIDLAFQALQSKGIKRGFINAGGDLFCWGKNPENDSWKIGIKHPRKSGYLGILSISNFGVATAGDYQRFFKVNGIRYHHLFNPRTGYPAQGKQSVSVIGPETSVCDGLATALFVSNQPQEIIKKYPNYGAIIVNSEGKVSVLGKSYVFRLT